MKNFKLLFCLLTLIPFLSSCEKDDDNSLSFNKNKVSIIIGKSEKITINGGDGTYTIKSSDEMIVTAKLATKEITVTGVKEGNAVVTVTDKSGKTGKLTVSVIKDPYASVKADAKTRFVWDKTSKIMGTDKGTYKLSQGTDGKVEFSWKSEDAKSTISLTFSDKVGAIAEGLKKDAKLLIDGKETKVASLEVIQAKVVNVGEQTTVWIAFSAGSKIGVCVGQMAK